MPPSRSLWIIRAAMASRLNWLIGARPRSARSSAASSAASPVSVIRWMPASPTSQLDRTRSSAAPRDAATTSTSDPPHEARKSAHSRRRGAYALERRMRRTVATIRSMSPRLLLFAAATFALSAQVATFSIVARDPANGDLGVAVASRYFSVGSVVPWAEAGIGAVATQANVNVGYGPRGIDLLKQGRTAKEVLDQLLAEDKFEG